jgi:hypothetical protein
MPHSQPFQQAGAGYCFAVSYYGLHGLKNGTSHPHFTFFVQAGQLVLKLAAGRASALLRFILGVFSKF